MRALLIIHILGTGKHIEESLHVDEHSLCKNALVKAFS